MKCACAPKTVVWLRFDLVDLTSVHAYFVSAGQSTKLMFARSFGVTQQTISLCCADVDLSLPVNVGG